MPVGEFGSIEKTAPLFTTVCADNGTALPIPPNPTTRLILPLGAFRPPVDKFHCEPRYHPVRNHKVRVIASDDHVVSRGSSVRKPDMQNGPVACQLSSGP